MPKEKLIPNSTQVPNVILDLLIPRLPEAEARCMLYICRRTYGFHKREDRISFSQFIKGIKDKNGKQLDYGAGLARSSLSEALKNLKQAEAVFVRKDNKGNYYEINLDMNIDKVVRKVNQLRKKLRNKPKQEKLFKVVRKPNQFGSRTKIGRASEPKSVHFPNPQKKGNKGNKDNMSDKPTGWNLEEEIKKCLKDPKRHIQIIGVWIKEKELRPENAEQMQSIIKRNCKPARLLNGYSNEDIHETVEAIRRTDYLKKWTLETIAKYIDEVVAQKRKQGRKIIRWEEVIKPDGTKAMRAIYEEK